MNHVTDDTWTDKIDKTHIVVRRTYDIYSKKDVYELVLCDDIDPHCKFWCLRGLDNFQRLGETILELVKAAKAKREENL